MCAGIDMDGAGEAGTRGQQHGSGGAGGESSKGLSRATDGGRGSPASEGVRAVCKAVADGVRAGLPRL